jgi:hypothetical protein
MLKDTVRADRLLEIGSGYRKAKVLLSAIALDLFSTLAAAPLDVVALTNRLEINLRGARDFFDALVALGLLTRDANGLYQNTSESDYYLDKAKPTYLGASFDQYDRREYPMWGSLTESLRTGKPWADVSGHDHFKSLYEDPARFSVFVNAMTSGSLLAAWSIAEQFPWTDYKKLCDIGTAQGCLPVQVALSHPHITAIGFDLPQLKPAFEQYAQGAGLLGQLSFKAGDFFKDQLPDADVIVLGRVLHNWDLATKKMLLEKTYQALPSGGAVLVYDMLIDDERSSSTSGLLSSLNMLLWTAGGFGYSGADCIGWMRETGFKEMRVDRLSGGNSMIVGRK